VALVPPEAAEAFASRVITSFDDRVPSLYDPEDASASSIEAKDREGQLRRFPIVSVSLGITCSLAHRFSNHRDVSKTMRLRLDDAKRVEGSCYAIDPKATRHQPTRWPVT
jgi:hypothetical protein